MKKKSAQGPIVGSLPYAQLLESTRSAVKVWTAVNNALQSSLGMAEPGTHTPDPFAVLQVIKDIRADTNLLGRIERQALESAEGWAHEAMQVAAMSFDGDLRALCVGKDVAIAGRYPAYVLNGFL